MVFFVCFLNFLFMFLVVLCCYSHNLKMATSPNLSVLPWYKEGVSPFTSAGDSQSSQIFSVVVFFTCLGRLLMRKMLGFFLGWQLAIFCSLWCLSAVPWFLWSSTTHWTSLFLLSGHSASSICQFPSTPEWSWMETSPLGDPLKSQSVGCMLHSSFSPSVEFLVLLIQLFVSEVFS